MDRFYNDAIDKNVAAVKIWADSDNKFYYKSTCQEADEVPAADMFNLFIKGVVCEKDDVWYKALSCDEDGVIDFGFPTESESEDVAG